MVRRDVFVGSSCYHAHFVFDVAFGIPVSFAFGAHTPEDQRKLLSWMEQINRKGSLVSGQAAVRNQGSLQSLRSKYHPFAGHPTFVTQLADLPYPDMLRQMQSPEIRQKLLSETSFFHDKPFAQAIFNPANLYPLLVAGVPRYERASTESFQALANSKEDPLALIYDALVREEVLWAPLTGTASEDRLLDLIRHPHVRPGLGDGGAHLGIFQEAGCPTYLLTHYTRDRQLGCKISIEEAVKLQTQDTATAVGLRDRGVLKAGLRADINVIDLESLRLHEPQVRRDLVFRASSRCLRQICPLPSQQMVHDLPTAAGRWIQTASGYRLTMVAGVATYENSTPTGYFPGRLVRHPFQDGQLSVRVLSEINPESIAGPEPRSTNDLLLADEDLAGGGSAIKRAYEANRAKMIQHVGEFLSGELLRKGDDRQTSKL